MAPNFWEVYLLACMIVAVGYGLLASCTALFYKHKALGQLKPNELKVKQGRATPEVRIDLFVKSFFSCFFSYRVYLLALILSGGICLLLFLL